MQTKFLSLALFLGCLLSSGCGDGRVETAQVSGLVSYNGEPISEGAITFESPGMRPASGKIRDGIIVDVTTYEQNDGVPVGSHKVAISAISTSKDSAVVANPGEVQEFDPNYMGGGDSLIPAKYSDPATSGLTAEVQSGGENLFTFELTSE